MVFGCTNNIVKIIVVFVNFLICIGGAIVFGVGLSVKLDRTFSDQVQKALADAKVDFNLDSYTNVIWGLVVLGAVMFVIGFLGCGGACCESSVLLSLYFVSILIILIVQVGLIVAAFVYKGKFKEEMKQALDKATPEELKKLEDELKCSGSADCAQKIYDEVLTEKVPIVAGVAVAIVAVELVAMCFACMLRNAVSRPGHYV